MTDTDNHIDKSELIEKYIAGALSMDEQRVFERLRESDSFFREAIEGLATLDTDVALKDINMLRREKATQRNRWLAIAAGISVIAISGYFVWQSLPNNPQTEVAQQVGETQAEDVPEEEDFTPQQEQPADDIQSANEQEERTAQEPAVTTNRTNEPPPVESDAVQRRSGAQSLTQQEELPVERSIESEPEPTAALLAADESPVLSESQDNAGINTITSNGIVSDEDGNPISGATIATTTGSQATVTDTDGRFSIEVEEGDNIVASFIGFKSIEKEASAELDFQLEADVVQLSEEVVTRPAEPEPSAAAKSASNVGENSPAQPTGGWDAYKAYLSNSLIYPVAADTSDISGDVVLSASIGPTGEISKISVVKGLGYGCDEEAIRLVENGPAFEPRRQNGLPEASETSITVTFSKQ